MDKKTIIGLCFRCADCGKTFRIGKTGVKACQKRVMKHVFDNSHFNIPPVNAPIGLTYKAEHGDKTLVFKGGEIKEYLKQVEAAVMETKGNMIPQLELTEV